MAHSGTTVTAPVSFADVNYVLGTRHTDLGALCQENLIKKWAKFKPMAYPTIGILSDSVRSTNNYGIINIPTWGNINKMKNYWFGIDMSSTNYPDCGDRSIFWGYRKPVGGSSEPFRLTDFVNAAGTRGYYHNAEAPIGGSAYDNYSIDSSGNLTFVFNYGVQDSDAIALSDLVYPRNLSYSVGNMHLGVMMRNKSNGNVYAVTRSDTISSGITSVPISGLSSSYNGTYLIFPFLSSDVIPFTSSLGQYTNGDFIALNGVEEVGVGATVVKFEPVEGTFWATRDTTASTRDLYIGLVVKNVNSGQGSARIDFTVYNESNAALATGTKSISNVSIGSSIAIKGTNDQDFTINMSSLGNLRNAFSVRAIITPTNVTNYATTSADTTVTDASERPRDV